MLQGSKMKLIGNNLTVLFGCLYSIALTTAEVEIETTTTTAVTNLPSWSTIKHDAPVLNVDAYGGHVFAKSDVGLLELVGDVLVADDLLGNLPIKRVWIQPPTKQATAPALYVVTTEGKLYQAVLTGSGKREWLDCLEGTDLEGRKVLDVHGKAEFLVFIIQSNKVGKGKSKTIRGDIYLTQHTSTDKTFAIGTEIGSFPATFVTVSPKLGTIATYGDYHGPYGAGVGVTSDMGKKWRHAVPQAAGKEGKVYVDEDRVVVTSAIGNVMVSYDKGRSYKALTPTRGKLPFDHYTDVAAMDNLIFVATQKSGLFVSADDGETFERRSTSGYNNFPSDSLNAVAVDLLDNKVYVAFNNGLSTRDISGHGANEPDVRERLSLWKGLTQEAKAIF